MVGPHQLNTQRTSDLQNASDRPTPLRTLAIVVTLRGQTHQATLDRKTQDPRLPASSHSQLGGLPGLDPASQRGFNRAVPVDIVVYEG